MKNIKGQEIYKTTIQKEAFYQKVYGINDPTLFKKHTPIKDDYFNEVLLPFCHEVNIKTVLDVGANDGSYSARFEDAGFDVTAMEISSQRTEDLRRILDTFGYTNIKTICGDIDEASIAIYDLIFLSDIVEHLESYKRVWKKCLGNSKYVFALIPKGDSWNWSPDHTVKFDDSRIQDLIWDSSGFIRLDVLQYDQDNSWYALIAKGNL